MSALGLLIIVAVAALVRFAHLSARSLWSDELFSVYFAAQGPNYILGPGARIETNPPLYYLTLWGWMRLWGDGENAVRSLSAVLSMLALVPIYRLGAALQGRATALAAAALFAVSGSEIYFAREARPYALFILCAAWALYGLAAVLRGRRGAAACMTAASVAAIYAHDVGFILAAGIVAVLVLSLVLEPHRRRHDGAVLAIFTAIVALAAAPQLYIAAHQLHSGNLAWIPSGILPAMSALQAIATGLPIFDAVAAMRSGAITRPFFGAIVAAMAVLVLLMLALWLTGVWRRRRDWPVPAVSLALPAIALIALGAISLVRPILLDRTVIWLLPCLFSGIGIGLVAIDNAPARRAALAALMLLMAGLTAADFRYSQSEPWRALTQRLSQEIQPGDVVVLSTERQAHTPAIAIAYYWRGPHPPLLRRWESCGDCATTAEAALDERAVAMPQVSAAQVQDLLRAGTGVWIVSRTPFAGDTAEMASLMAAVTSVAHPTDAFDWRDRISITRWQRD